LQDFRNLKVWERSHQLALALYRASAVLPAAEQYTLTPQLRRSAIFVPSLIAEGCGRGSDSDFRRFLQMAMGSASELEYQLLLARDLSYLDPQTCDELNTLLLEVKRMLTALITRLRGPRQTERSWLKPLQLMRNTRRRQPAELSADS